MQIHDHVDRKYRPEPSNDKISDHRQKRKGRKYSKKLGVRYMRRKFKLNEEPIFTKSIEAFFGGYRDSPMYGGWHEEYGEQMVYEFENGKRVTSYMILKGDPLPVEVRIRPMPRNAKMFAKWRKHQ